ncbi:hypothetical protein MRX96_042719 [Rhipicephalus microplus]
MKYKKKVRSGCEPCCDDAVVRTAWGAAAEAAFRCWTVLRAVSRCLSVEDLFSFARYDAPFGKRPPYRCSAGGFDSSRCSRKSSAAAR